MPQTEIRVFRDEDGACPLVNWLNMLRTRQPKAYSKCLARIIDLAREGTQLRRPLSDYLRDGIRELRIKSGRVNYRILYSFVGSQVAVLTHGLIKQAAVPDAELDYAIRCLNLVRSDPQQFTAEFEV
jgi:putative component of toxin-antitoxin plasmid stabilization module